MKRKFIIVKFCFSFLFFSQFHAQTSWKEKETIIEGNQAYIQKDFVKATNIYQSVLSKNNTSEKASYNLGNALYEQENYTEAREQYLKALKLTDDKEILHKLYHNIGNTYLEHKKYAEAVDYFKQAILNNPEDSESRYNYAYAKSKLKKDKSTESREAQEQKKSKVYDEVKKMIEQSDSLMLNGQFQQLKDSLDKKLFSNPEIISDFSNEYEKLRKIIEIDSMPVKQDSTDVVNKKDSLKNQ